MGDTPKSSTMSKNMRKLLGDDFDEALIKVDLNLPLKKQIQECQYQLPQPYKYLETKEMLSQKKGVLDCPESSTSALFFNHLQMLNVFKPRYQMPKTKKYTDFKQLHLCLTLTNVALATEDTTGDSYLEAYISLFNNQNRKFVSEEYIVKVDSSGDVTVPDKVITFLDLTPPDMNDLHVVIRIFRVGGLQIEKKARGYPIKTVRRPVCCCTLPIPVKRINSSLSDNKTISIAARAKTWELPDSNNEKDFSDMHEVIIKGGMNDLKIHKACAGISYNYRIITGRVSDIKNAVQEFNGFATKYRFVPKKQFPCLRPSESRHFIFLDLIMGDFTRLKFKNIAIDIELRNNKYQTIPSSLVRGYGPMAECLDTYRTSVYYHQQILQWRERVTVLLPELDTWEGLHLHFLVSNVNNNGKEECFGFAYHRIHEDQSLCVLKDSESSLSIYKYSNRDDEKNKGYLEKFTDAKFAESRKQKQVTLTIATVLCSSEASQDNIFGQVLSWKIVPEQLLLSYLKRLHTERSIFDIFDQTKLLFRTLFSIMLSRQYNDEEHPIHVLSIRCFLKFLVELITDINKPQIEPENDTTRQDLQHSNSVTTPTHNNNTSESAFGRMRASTGLTTSSSLEEKTMEFPTKLIDYYIEPDSLNTLEYFYDTNFTQYGVYRPFLIYLESVCMFAAGNAMNDFNQVKLESEYQDIVNVSKTAGYLFRLLVRSYIISMRGEDIDENPKVYNELRGDLKHILAQYQSVIAAPDTTWLHTIRGNFLKHFIQIYEICLSEKIFTIEQLIDFIKNIIIDTSHGCNSSEDYSKCRLQFLVELVIYLSKPMEKREVIINQSLEETEKKRIRSKYEAKHNCLKLNLLERDDFKPIITHLIEVVNFHMQDDRSLDEKFLACRLMLQLTPCLQYHISNEHDNDEISVTASLVLGVLTPICYFQHDILQAQAANEVDNLILSRLDNDFHEGINILMEVSAVFLSIMSEPILNKRRLTHVLYMIRSTTDIQREKDWLMFVFEILIHMSTNSMFPKHWILMRMKELQTCFYFISWAVTHMISNYMNKDSLILWKSFTLLCCEFWLSPSLELELTPLSYCDMVIAYYGDMRLPFSSIFQMTWYYLGDYQLDLIEVVLPRLIELGQFKLNQCALMGRKIFFELFVKEYKAKGNVKNFLDITIDAVGKIATQYSGTQLDRYRDFFRVHMKQSCESDSDEINKIGISFLGDIENLFDRLVELESFPRISKFETELSSRCIHLLAYLMERNKMDLYRKYAHYLCQLHYNLNNKVEFANSMRLISDSMKFSDEILPPYHDSVFSFPAQSVTVRKINLLRRSITAYDEAQYWEQSAEVCKDLAKAYEHVLFNYQALPVLHQQMSTYWEKILNTDRIYNAFYRIAFVGSAYKDMPCREFVYRSGNGLILESVRDFTMRIKAKFPDSHIENSSDLPKAKNMPGGEDEKKHYIQITTLNCSSLYEMEGKMPWYKENGLPGTVLKYHEENNINVWTYTRVDKTKQKKKEKGENEYRDLWIVRTFLKGTLTLPSYSRVIEITERKDIIICPLENAVNVLNQKNIEIRMVIKRIQSKANIPGGDVRNELGPLSMNLSGVIDAAVMGGVAKYREAFFDGTYVAEFPSHARFIPLFRDAMRDQIEVLREGLDVFGHHCQENLLPLYEHLQATYRKMKAELTWMDEIDVNNIIKNATNE